MKTIKIILFIGILMFCSTQHSYAQIFDILGLNASKSIVRNFNNDLNLMYIRGGNNAFILTDNGGNAYYFHIPYNYIINDLEIMDGMAFFCGTTTNDQALAGQFDILGVFFSGSNIDYFFLNPGMYGIFYVDMYSFNKLDVFRDYNGHCHMALVGEKYIDSSQNERRSTVADIYFDGIFWNICIFYNKSGLIWFQDIACTGSVIAAVGKRGVLGCVTPFWQTNHFPANFCNPNIFYCVNTTFMYAGDNYLITCSGANRATLAFQSSRAVETAFIRLEFSTANGTPSTYLPTLCVTPPSAFIYNGYPWQLYELRHDRNYNYVYLLENAQHLSNPTFERWLLQVSATVAQTSISTTSFPVPSQVSLDVNNTTNLPFVAGYSTTTYRPSISHPFNINTISNCYNPRQMFVVDTTTTIIESTVWDSYEFKTEPNFTLTPTIQMSKRIVSCQ